MFELTRKVLSGTVLAAITGGVLLWGLSPGMTLKREYESYNGKPAGSEHTLQAITVPAYANVQGVTALEACTLQDGILVLAYAEGHICSCGEYYHIEQMELTEQEVTTMLAAVRAAAAAAEQEADEILARKQNVQRKNYKRQAVAKA